MSARRWVMLSLACVCGALCGPAVAQATVGAGAFWTAFPDTVTVGETIPGSLSVQNLNDGADFSTFNSVCNAGDASLPCANPEPGIVSVPSCGQLLPGPQCAAAGADPGVFEFSPIGMAHPASYCAGTLFAITVVDPTFGTVRFTPLPIGTHVSMPGFHTCDIRFNMRAVRLPSIDAEPTSPGIQTARLTTHTQWAGVFDPGAANARGTATGVSTVLPGPPPPPSPPPALPDVASFAGSATSLRVSSSGRFAIRFVATPGRTGKAKLTSTKKVKIGSSKRKMKIPSKSFTASADGKAKTKFKLSAKDLKVLKRTKTLKFKVTVTVGTKSFSAKLKLKAPKQS